MIVTFKNTGMIEEADICFGGLTVIAGENDTGKSTIGKLMFSLIKTFNRYERDARSSQVRSIQTVIDDCYFEFRKENVDSSVLEAGKTFFDELKNEALSLINKELSKEATQSVIFEKLKNFIGFVQGLADIQIDIKGLSGKLASLIRKKPGKEEIFQQTLSKYIGSMFSSEMVNKFTDMQEYFITGKEGKTVIFEISGKNGPGKITLYDRLYFEDATFIESPILLNLPDTLRFSKTLFDKNGETKKQAELLEKAYVPEYMKDLMLKLTERSPREQTSDIVVNIRDIIKGDFYYDHKENDFVFKKENKIFKGLSISPGIKYLGSIGILEQVGFLNKNSLLIMDEPETHIHPQWQIRFAEVLVKLVKEGSNILLTSHSPYLIEALKLYSDRLLEESRANFYISEGNENKCTSQIHDVTHDVSPIFDTLAEPLDKLESLQ
jgi:hypothetical protein